MYICCTLVQAWACDLEAARPSYDNDLIDSRNRFLEIHNTGKTSFLTFNKVEPSRILTMAWQTGSGHGSNYMK